MESVSGDLGNQSHSGTEPNTNRHCIFGKQPHSTTNMILTGGVDASRSVSGS